MALMDMLKVNLMGKEEVYRTLLAVLCDYDPKLQGSRDWAKRYINLLVSDKVLANCLLMSLPPQIDGPTQGSSSRPTTPLNMLPKHMWRNKRLIRGKSTPLLAKSMKTGKNVHREPVHRHSIGSDTALSMNSSKSTNEITATAVGNESSSMDQPLDYRMLLKATGSRVTSGTTHTATTVLSTPQSTEVATLPINNAFASLAQIHSYSQWMQNKTLPVHLLPSSAQNIISGHAVPVLAPGVNVMCQPVMVPDIARQQVPPKPALPSLLTATSLWQCMTNIDKLAYVASNSLISSQAGVNQLYDVPLQTSLVCSHGQSEALNLTQAKGTDTSQRSFPMEVGQDGRDCHVRKYKSESDINVSRVPRTIRRKLDLDMQSFPPKRVKLFDAMEINPNNVNAHNNASENTASDMSKVGKSSLQALAELTTSICSKTNEKSKNHVVTSGCEVMRTSTPAALSPGSLSNSPNLEGKSNSRKGLKAFPYSQKIMLPDGQTSTINFQGNCVTLADLQISAVDPAVFNSLGIQDDKQFSSDKENMDIEFPAESSNQQLKQSVTKLLSSYGSTDKDCNKSTSNSSSKNNEICISYSKNGGIVIGNSLQHAHKMGRSYSDTSHIPIVSKVQGQNAGINTKQPVIGGNCDSSVLNRQNDGQNLPTCEHVSESLVTPVTVGFSFMTDSHQHILNSLSSKCKAATNQMYPTPQCVQLPSVYRPRSRSDSDIYQVQGIPIMSLQDQHTISSNLLHVGFGQGDAIHAHNVIAGGQPFIYMANGSDNTAKKSLQLQHKDKYFAFKNSTGGVSSHNPLLRAELSTDVNTTKPLATASNALNMSSLKQQENIIASKSARYVVKELMQNTNTVESLPLRPFSSVCNTASLKSLSDSAINNEARHACGNIHGSGLGNKGQAVSRNTDAVTDGSLQPRQVPVNSAGTNNRSAVNVSVILTTDIPTSASKSISTASACTTVPDTYRRILPSVPSNVCTSTKDYTEAKPMIATVGCNDGNLIDNTELDKYKRHVLLNDFRFRNTKFLSEGTVKPCRVVAMSKNKIMKVVTVTPTSSSASIKPLCGDSTHYGSGDSLDGLPEMDKMADEVFLEEVISHNVKKFTKKAVATVRPQSQQ